MNSAKLKQEKSRKFSQGFPITSVCRADLQVAGFDTTKVDDWIMSELASKMANAYCDGGFWADLDILAEHLKVPRRKKLSTLNRI